MEGPPELSHALCCRTAQKQCCISYLKEKSCVAGVMAAKEEEACGSEDGDTCGVSLYKASSVCGQPGSSGCRSLRSSPGVMFTPWVGGGDGVWAHFGN